MRTKTSPPISAFEKILRAFETGGFAYTDVLVQLKRLLATGASPGELLDILSRRERIEPLPEYAHSELVRVLNEAVVEGAAEAEGFAEAQTADQDAAQERIPNSVAGAVRATYAAVAAERAERQDSDVAVAQAAPPALRIASRPAANAPGPALDAALLARSVRSLEERIARQDADHQTLVRSYDLAKQAESATAARAEALAADLAAARTALESERHRAREIDKALAENSVSAKTANLRGEEALRESERLQTESRMLRDALGSREATITQILHSLGERDAQLAALQEEHAKIAPVLEARAKTGAQMQAELQAVLARAAALTADLAEVRTALESERTKGRDIDKTLAEKAAAIEALRSREEEALRQAERSQAELRTVRGSLVDRDSNIAQMLGALAERDAELAELRQEHAKMLPVLEARGKTGALLQSDLQAARARIETVSLELKASQEAATALGAQLELAKSELSSARTELGSVRREASTHLEELQSREWRRGFDQNLFREWDARTDAEGADRDGALQAERSRLQAEVADLQRKLDAQSAVLEELRKGADAQRTAEMRAVAQRRESEAQAASRQRELEVQAAARPRELEAQAAGRQQESETQAAAQRREPERVPDATQQRTESIVQKVLPQSAQGALIVEAKPARVASAPPPAAKPPAAGLGGAGRSRALALGAVVCVLAVLVWFVAHRSPPPVRTPPATPVVAVPVPGTVIRDCPECPGMTVLPAGRFQQGSSGAENGSPSFEAPLHTVAIGRSLAMSTNAVTVDEFRQFVAATQRDMQGCDIYDGEWKHRPKNNWQDPGFAQTGMHPVTCASWVDADAYARWLSTKTGHRYRLPSASEWEYAARAGGVAQPWGTEGSGACSNANVADESAARRYPGWQVFACDDGYVYTSPVGTFKTNSFGLHDMLGNVFQWTQDCWHADYSAAPTDGSARVDGDCSQHELRGGSWFSTPAYVRASYRNHFAADYRTSSVGIRLVRELEQ